MRRVGPRRLVGVRKDVVAADRFVAPVQDVAAPFADEHALRGAALVARIVVDRTPSLRRASARFRSCTRADRRPEIRSRRARRRSRRRPACARAATRPEAPDSDNRARFPSPQSAGCSVLALIPASLTTFAQRSFSRRMNVPNSSGDMSRTSAPCAASRSFMSGVCRILPTSAPSFATISRGVPGGARMPCHEPVSKPGRPCSATVGTSGIALTRLALDTARMRSLPLFTCGYVASMPLNSTSA